MSKEYYFDWQCTNPKCGLSGSSAGDDALYKFCPYCGSKVKLSNVEEWEAEKNAAT